GSPSTGRSRASWTSCRTAPWAIRRSGCSSPAVCPRSCCTCGGSGCSTRTVSRSRGSGSGDCSTGGRAQSGGARCASGSARTAWDVLVLACRGPMGAGMEEIYQITAALKHLSWGKHVAVITDARFSGVSTGACIGHVGPEALAGGPIGKVLDGDLVQIVVDRNRLEGSVDLVGHGETRFGAEEGADILKKRPPRPD